MGFLSGFSKVGFVENYCLNVPIFGPVQSIDKFMTSLGEYLKKKFKKIKIRVAECSSHGYAGLQNPENPENADVQAKKNQWSQTDFINKCDGCGFKMTPILHFQDDILVHFINKKSYRGRWSHIYFGLVMKLRND